MIGPGWLQQLLMTAGLLILFIAGLKMIAVTLGRRESDQAPDAMLVLWHRYEEGDLTRAEFERAKQSLREWPSEA